MIPNEKKLLDMLSNNDVTFFIPPYQRNYEWTQSQCQVFLDDVIKTYKQSNSGKSTEHFFGTITFFQTEAAFGQPNKLVLIDGQQRITTTMLFLVALRDLLGKQELGSFIDNKYLKNNNVPGESEYKVKLKQVETDWATYKSIILSDELTIGEKDSAVYRNYSFFLNKLSDLRSEGNDLMAIIEKGLNRFSVITIELQPDKNVWENPQEIFESMNSLGKPLSLADLVRNYLLLGLKPSTQEDLYNRYWLRIEKKIPGRISDFIRDYMQAHEKKAFKKATESNYKELYSMFKIIFEQTDAKELLKNLSDSASIYAYLLRFESTGEKQIDGLLKDITINVTTAYSFLLVLLRSWKQGRFTTEDMADILEAFRIYCLRRRLIGLTNAENKSFPTLVARVPELEKAKNKKEAMYDVLSKQESNLRLPNDIEISRYLETANFYNFKHCKFYLSLIEETITKSRPDQNDGKLQIEHIMPQSLNDEWKSVLGENYEEKHQANVNLIGNLTLIRHNQELGQKSFAEKKVIYEEKAGLQIAKTEIINHSIWTVETIKQRNNWMISFLLTDVLPIPERRRKINNYSVKVGTGLSFQDLQLIGLDISFIDDPTIMARVIGDTDVEFEGKKWKLPALTKEIYRRKGTDKVSAMYQGSRYWEYDGIRLSDIL